MLPTKSFLPLAASLALAPFALAQAPLTYGNLVVVRIGDNLSPNTSGVAAPTFLDEYTPAGVYVQTIAMPTTTVGANHALTNAGTATSEGQLNLSVNGQYLTLCGYDAPVGTTTVTETSATTNPRVVARVDLLGNVDTTTTVTDAFSGALAAGANIRGAATDDGSRFWVSGSKDGVRFVANLGDSTTTGLNAGAPFNLRQITIFHNDLYVTSASGTVFGVAKVGTGGLPTAGTQSITLLNGFPNATGPSTYDMFWASPTRVYVADDQTGGGGGIRRWDLAAGTWTNTATFQLPLTGCTGLTGFVLNGVTTLWATTRVGSGATSIVQLIDAGPGSPLTQIVAAPTNARFRGIRRVGALPIQSLFPIGCGAAGIKVTGTAEMNTPVFVSVTNPGGFPIMAFGVTPLFFQPFGGCSCALGHDWLVYFVAADFTLDVQASWGAVAGLDLYVQAADVFAPGGCTDPMLTLSDTMSFRIQ